MATNQADPRQRHPFPKGPCTQTVNTLGLKYLCKAYLDSKSMGYFGTWKVKYLKYLHPKPLNPKSIVKTSPRRAT